MPNFSGVWNLKDQVQAIAAGRWQLPPPKYELYTWGNNSGGELGHNTPFFSDTSSPVQVGALTNWAQVSASGSSNGSAMTAAVKTDGTLWTWGYAGSGRLGINIGAGRRSSPVQVGALTNWSEVSSGGSGAGAIKTDGSLWMWGIGSSGQIGNNSTANTSSPVQVGALTDWYRLTVGRGGSVTAVKTDGTLWSWGNNTYGLLGDGTAGFGTVDKSSPVQIGALTNWDRVSAAFHCMAIKTDGTLWVWGSNLSGRLGDNTVASKSSPVQIGALTNWAQVSAGSSFSVAVTTGGELYTWGSNGSGNLGNGTTVSRSSPVQVGVLTNWATINAGNFGVAAVKTDGTLWVWGKNDQGQIGDGTTVAKSSPVQVGALTTWTQASTGYSHTAAITES